MLFREISQRNYFNLEQFKYFIHKTLFVLKKEIKSLSQLYKIVILVLAKSVGIHNYFLKFELLK